ncbi:hypothetical protein [Rhizobium sp. AN83]|uniref:hypothetical protein n=1 Tax=Rhizobium sp. AN83 TaxID=3035217 RepID=UPI002B256B33|nr:hypothetical protein [Rhizobium sp. AN83]
MFTDTLRSDSIFTQPTILLTSLYLRGNSFLFESINIHICINGYTEEDYNIQTAHPAARTVLIAIGQQAKYGSFGLSKVAQND